MKYVFVLLLKVFFVNSMPFDNSATQHCGVEVSSNPLHQNPWMAFLIYFHGDQQLWLRCAGTILSARHVVTAAHCVKDKSFDHIKVRLGEYDVRYKIDCIDNVCGSQPLLIDVDAISVHPHYQGFAHDIAVLTLQSLILFSDFIRPICLPSKMHLTKETFTAAGWGEVKPGIYSNVKKLIPLRYRSEETCQQAYKHTRLPSSIICAGGDEGVDTCRGDSGGPLMLKVGGKMELWGITNAGNPVCGLVGFPGVYTSVSDYVPWLHKIMNTK